MAEQLKSIYGAYAENLQAVIDTGADRFKPLWYTKYFTVDTPGVSLTFSEMIGRTRIEAVATIVDRDSAAPIRSRPGMENFNGVIPPMMEKFAMTQNERRDWEVMKRIQTSNTVVRDAILNNLFNDSEKAGYSCHKRMDMMCLEAVSTGAITISAVTNPDGVVIPDGPVNLLMKAENKANASVSWDSPTTAKPLMDIQNMVKQAEERGLGIEKMLMAKSMWYLLQSTNEVRDTMMTFHFGGKATGTNTSTFTTLARVNEYLNAQLMPTIELVDETVGIESDGIVAPYKPWNQNNVSFIPSGNLGVIKSALAIEQISPTPNISYGNYRGALISRWGQNSPWQEFTQAEWNACPALTSIDNIFILRAKYA